MFALVQYLIRQITPTLWGQFKSKRKQLICPAINYTAQGLEAVITNDWFLRIPKTMQEKCLSLSSCSLFIKLNMGVLSGTPTFKATQTDLREYKDLLPVSSPMILTWRIRNKNVTWLGPTTPTREMTPTEAGIPVRAYPGSEFIVANTLAKWKMLEPNEINFSQGLKFSQKVVWSSCFFYLTFCMLGATFVVCW